MISGISGPHAGHAGEVDRRVDSSSSVTFVPMGTWLKSTIRSYRSAGQIRKFSICNGARKPPSVPISQNGSVGWAVVSGKSNLSRQKRSFEALRMRSR